MTHLEIFSEVIGAFVVWFGGWAYFLRKHDCTWDEVVMFTLGASMLLGFMTVIIVSIWELT
jgi:predicted phage tail protein